MKGLSWLQLEGVLGCLAGQEDFVFLDSSRPDQENCRSLLFTEPVAQLRCQAGADAADFLRQIEDWLGQGYYLAGWFSYGFGGLLEEKLAVLQGNPASGSPFLADLGVYRTPRSFDHGTGEGDFPSCLDKAAGAGWEIAGLQPNVGHREYLQAIRKLHEYIAAGDTYQVNYTLKLLFRWHGSAEALYRDLRDNQTVPYGAYIRRGGERILSFSPELFFRRDGSGLVVRPMKGTARRGRNQAEDDELRRGLREDGKNRSENVMIVDLLRNDLARLMHSTGGGEVWVSSLFDVETYESLLQMTSTVMARTGEGGGSQGPRLFDLFHALFPCGSVTGAPKIRTMEIIAELEKEERGVYTGAIGYLAPDGQAVFSVPIRTVVLRGDHGEMGIGSGIIHDSDAEQEWRECLLKGRFLSHCRPGFELLETMLWQPDSGYWLLDAHLARMAGSASEMRFSWSEIRIRQDLQQAAEAFSPRCMRVRLTLAKDGTSAIAAQPCDPPRLSRLPLYPPEIEGGLPEVGFSRQVTAGDFPWLRHKTTRREIYDGEFAAGRDKGLYDVLLRNDKGEVTEGCITNIVVYADGEYRTPPLACGLLPGVMRQLLLRDTERPVRECRLSVAEVQNAEAIYLCNSVRGLVRVALRQ